MNVGFVEAMSDFNWTCAIFHDVDMLPEDLRNLYLCPEQPRHMSVAVDKYKYKLPYSGYFGGVTALRQDHYRQGRRKDIQKMFILKFLKFRIFLNIFLKF